MAKIFTLFLLLTFSFNTYALDYFWVGNSGNWSDFATHWATTSGGAVFHSQVPTSGDNVFFDINSFTVAGQTVTADQTIILCRDMDWTGVLNSPTFATASTSNQCNIYGSLTLIGAMNLTFNGKINFLAVTGGHRITTAGQLFKEDIYFNGLGGDWTLLDNLTGFSPDYDGIYLEAGTLNTNGQTVTAGKMWSTTSTARTLNLGTSIFNIGSNVIPGYWYISGSNMTLNAGTSTINTIGNTTKLNFKAGSKTYYNVVCFASETEVTGSNTYSNNLTVMAGKTLSLTSGTTQTLGGSLTAVGTCTNSIIFRSLSPGSAATISKATGAATIEYVNLIDNAAIGGATFTANNSVDGSGNSGWIINALVGQDYFWIGNNGNWSNTSNWSLSSGGPPSSCLPSSVDNVFFDNNSFNGAGQSATIDISNAECRNMTWAGATNTPTFATTISSNQCNIYGSLTFMAAMNLTFNGKINFRANSAGHTITTAGQIFKEDIYFRGPGGEWTLLDDITGFSPDYDGIYLEAGTLNTNSQTVTAGKMWSTTSTARTLNLDASIFNIGSHVIPGYWYISGSNMTLNAGTSTVNTIGNTTKLNFKAGNKTYYNVVCFASETEVTGSNTYSNNLTVMAGKVLDLASGTTQTLGGTLTAVGTCTNSIIFQSSTPGSQATISKAAGSATIEFVNLIDNTAIGGATFTANNSVDGSGNSGWIINALVGQDYFWIGNNGNWSNTSNWSLSSGGPPNSMSRSNSSKINFAIKR